VRRLLGDSSLVLASLLVGALAAPRLHGQTAPSDGKPLAFEVASIKPNTSGDLEQHIWRSATALTVTNMPVRQLILFAYVPLQPFQLVGGPPWIDKDRFDMVAKIEGEPPPPTLPGIGPDAFVIAMRTLLADHFKLQLHHEQREMDIYALALSKPASGPDARLRPSTVDCLAFAQENRGGLPGPPLPCRNSLDSSSNQREVPSMCS
jgi:uncharacterized protein (TIGR03435 family)